MMQYFTIMDPPKVLSIAHEDGYKEKYKYTPIAIAHCATYPARESGFFEYKVSNEVQLLMIVEKHFFNR
jgi:hypothetical protein